MQIPMVAVPNRYNPEEIEWQPDWDEVFKKFEVPDVEVPETLTKLILRRRFRGVR